MVDLATESVATQAVRPRMMSTLRMLLPTMLPTAMPALSFRAAVMLTAASGDGSDKLGQAGAHGHNGQTDDQLWDSEPVSKAGGSVHEPVCAFDQHDKAHDQ